MTLGKVQYEGRFVPQHGAAALKSEVWKREAMMPEMKSLYQMGCFGVVPESSMPPGAKLIKGRWVFVQKHETRADVRFQRRVQKKDRQRREVEDCE